MRRFALSNQFQLRGSMARMLCVAAWCSVALLVIAIMTPGAARAQLAGTGTIEGTIADSSGAVVPGATVVARNLATGAETVRTSTSAGLYNLSPLDAGDYSITVTAKGFEKLVRPSVHVDGMQVLALDLALHVGAENITVTVTTAPPLLETENATLGAAMEGEAYQSLPLEMGNAGSPDQRRVTDFATLMPGVSPNITKNNETDEPMVVNGNQNSSEMYIEGIPATSVNTAGDPRFIWSAISVEAVDQFQLKTSAYSAEYRGLGVENYTLKSGGKQFHGTFYDIFRNTALDAAGFIPAHYQPVGCASSSCWVWYTPPEHMNEYGISLGGPLFPFGRLKDKVFFFANYMGFRYSTLTTPAYQSIPTERMRGGDFTELLAPTGASGCTAATCSANGLNSDTAGDNKAAVQIFDPMTQYYTGGKYYRYQFGASGDALSTKGSYNVIPSNDLSPIATAMLTWMPHTLYGSGAATSQSLTNNYLGSYPWGLSNWSTTERIDFNLSSRQTLSVIGAAGRQGLIGNAGAQTTDVMPPPYMYAKVYAPITKDGMIEHSYTINNSLVNQFKYGAMQYFSPAYNPTLNTAAYGAGNSTIGIGNVPAGQTTASFPTVKFSSSSNTQWGPQASAGNVLNAYTFVDNMLWVHGRHSISFGGQLQLLEYNYLADKTGSSPLSLTYKSTESGNITTSGGAGSGGFDVASFMMGAVDSGSYTQYAPIANETGTRFRPYAFYANDDWKATSKLTINAGLRWDILPPFKEVQNRLSFLNPLMQNPYTYSAGALMFAGNGNNSCFCRTPVHTNYRDFGPRLGFAYSVDNKTVIRASYGMYYTLGGGTGGDSNASQPGSALELGYSVAPSPASPGVSLPVFYLNGASALSGYGTNAVNGYANDPYNTQFGVTSKSGSYSVSAPPIYDPGYGTYYSTNLSSSNVDYISTTLGYLDPKYTGRAPEFEMWSFGIQRSLTPDMTLTVSYVGNEAHYLVGQANASGTTALDRGYYGNALDPKWMSMGACLAAKATTGSITCTAPSGTAYTSGSTLQSAFGIALPYASFPTSQAWSQALLPFPQYKGVTNENDAVSNSNFNSLQLSLNQRLAHGLTLMVNYTFSKSIDNAGTTRAGYAIPAGVGANGKGWAAGKADRSLSVFDQRHNLNSTATYDLPFGKGHIGGGNAIVSNLVGGWRLAGVFTYIGGNPLQIIQSSCSGNGVGGTCMPAYNPAFTGPARQNGGWGHGATRTTLGTIQYVNPAAFLVTGTGGASGGSSGVSGNQYVIGDVARNGAYGLRGPGNYDIDATVRRTFNIWPNERVKFVLEASAFNALNHVWFGTTSTNASGTIAQSVGSSSFGTVSGQANNPRQFQFAGHFNF